MGSGCLIYISWDLMEMGQENAEMRSSDEPGMLKVYASAGGCGKIENLLIGGAKANFQNLLRAHTGAKGAWARRGAETHQPTH